MFINLDIQFLTNTSNSMSIHDTNNGNRNPMTSFARYNNQDTSSMIESDAAYARRLHAEELGANTAIEVQI
jgi:hypothetical protein